MAQALEKAESAGSRIKRLTRGAVERSTLGYSLLMRREHGIAKPQGRPNAPWHNAVLKSASEVEASVDQVRSLGLPLVKDRPKNWDSLAAADLILRRTNKNAKIFDAGGARYSKILPWLFLYGYKHLVAENLIFRRKTKRGPIVYKPGDITKTSYSDGYFDAITCMSVVEHGVDLKAYFSEMSRILKRGGVLITSTDYYETPIDTTGLVAYGCPIRIFSKAGIQDALKIANSHGLVLTSSLDYTSDEKVVRWDKFDLSYTFMIFSLEKQ